MNKFKSAKPRVFMDPWFLIFLRRNNMSDNKTLGKKIIEEVPKISSQLQTVQRD